MFGDIRALETAALSTYLNHKLGCGRQNNMRISYLRTSGLTFAAALVLGTVAYGQSLQFVSADGGAGLTVSYSGGLSEGTTAGPYNMSLNGSAILMYCDDAVDNVNWGQQWNIVTPTALSTLTSNTGSAITSVYFTGTTTTFNIGSADVTLSQAEQYVAVTYLMVEGLYGSFDSASTSLAIWDLMTPSHDGDPLVLTTAADTATYVQDAITFAQSYSYPGNGELNIGGKTYTSTIYTPSDCTLQGTCSPANNGATNSPQEFMSLTVPEPSSLAFLGFDFAGAGIVGLYFLRRKSATRS